MPGGHTRLPGYKRRFHIHHITPDANISRWKTKSVTSRTTFMTKQYLPGIRRFFSTGVIQHLHDRTENITVFFYHERIKYTNHSPRLCLNLSALS
jgi:hypothetical protein